MVQGHPSADVKTIEDAVIAYAASPAAGVHVAVADEPAASPCPRFRRAGATVPATQDLEITACALLAVGAAAAALALLEPIGGVAAPALVFALAAFGGAATLLCAAMALRPAAVRGGRARRPVRAAVIGPVASATTLVAELRMAGVDVVRVVGAIRFEPARERPEGRFELGALTDVARIVDEHRIDLLLVASNVPRTPVADVVMRACEGRAVRLCPLAAFYEEVFGHVPLTQIDGAWFEYLLHPRFRPRRTQRVFDIVVGGILAVTFLPVLAVAAAIVRLDGGPVCFKQRRIGRDGRPFLLYKLRTMHWEDCAGSPRWAASDDPRTTRVGRVLRRTHLDELPQLLCVLRGEMALVGPRPEQPEIAARLERSMPFWRGRYRHLPGLTGWAQIRCGYAGSNDGSAWKLAHDLYYLRRQSLVLDMAILLQTASTLLLAPRHLEHSATPYVLQRAALPGGKELGIGAAPAHSD
jgi:lipopolysaccharide/colanic/teichoic acid biosynthesis glycosyltransferase